MLHCKLRVATHTLNQCDGMIHFYQQVGWTALHLAATEGHVEVAELLLKKGCNINLLAGVNDV